MFSTLNCYSSISLHHVKELVNHGYINVYSEHCNVEKTNIFSLSFPAATFTYHGGCSCKEASCFERLLGLNLSSDLTWYSSI